MIRIEGHCLSINTYVLNIATPTPTGLLKSGSLNTREVCLVEIECELHRSNQPQTLKGFGECGALAGGEYDQQTPKSVFTELSQLRSSQPIANLVADTAPMSTYTRSTIEMALIDINLKSDRSNPGNNLRVPGLMPAGYVIASTDHEKIVAEADAAIASGYTRLKIKVDPDTDPHVIELICRRHSSANIDLDANGSFTDDTIQLVKRLFDSGVRMIEQPFKPSEPHLNELLHPHICADQYIGADESCGPASKNLVPDLVAQGFSAAVIKPQRLGGYTAAAEAIGSATESGFAYTIGGMMETALGRTALCTLPTSLMCIGTDISPATRWLVDPIFTDLDQVGEFVIPQSHEGIAGTPDSATLARHITQEHSTP